MSSRYVRNQRREHRNRIAELEKLADQRKREAGDAQMRRMSAEDRARNALEEALKTVVKQKPMIELAMERLGAELGRAMGPHFAEHVQKLKAADRERRTPELVSFNAAVPMDTMRVAYIEGRIEPLYYRLAVLDRL